LSRASFLLLFGPVLAACGGSRAAEQPGAKPARTEISDVERYLPLRADTVLAYDTYQENTGERGVLMMQVRRPRLGTVELDVGGRIQRLELDRAGVRLVTGGWLLKAPLSPGARFKGQFGEVEVTSVTTTVQVPAGRFTGCVQTVEQSATAQRKVTTVFCPDVGITVLEAEGSVGEEYGRERAELRSHGKRVDLDAM
jgi:hypothetical protein